MPGKYHQLSTGLDGSFPQGSCCRLTAGFVHFLHAAAVPAATEAQEMAGCRLARALKYQSCHRSQFMKDCAPDDFPTAIARHFPLSTGM